MKKKAGHGGEAEETVRADNGQQARAAGGRERVEPDLCGDGQEPGMGDRHHVYIWTLQGWVYLAVVIDLYSRRVVGWHLDRRMEKALASRAMMDGDQTA